MPLMHNKLQDNGKSDEFVQHNQKKTMRLQLITQQLQKLSLLHPPAQAQGNFLMRLEATRKLEGACTRKGIVYWDRNPQEGLPPPNSITWGFIMLCYSFPGNILSTSEILTGSHDACKYMMQISSLNSTQ